MKLKPEEFIRRFLSHVLPEGFMRIRSFGFFGLCERCNGGETKAKTQHKNEASYWAEHRTLLVGRIAGWK